MTDRERRQYVGQATQDELRSGLTPQQNATLDSMGEFGWTLKFVRRPLFQPPVPVAFDRAHSRYAIIEADGRINEDPGFPIRE